MASIAHQLILFGPPGTSKSFRARGAKAKALGVDEARIVPVTFHPDFGYGEFVARLMPLTRDGQIQYNVHAGPFIQALALAYLHLEKHNVLLLVDEINRGNCAEIFGDVFQLLDRDEQGWSSYDTSTSDLALQALEDTLRELSGHSKPFTLLHPTLQEKLKRKRLCLPPNLHLIGTMNTSDESIYFMDSAFKRRWHFEFCPVGFDGVPVHQRLAPMSEQGDLAWGSFVDALNRFIVARCTAPQLDDKLVGPWFVKARPNKQAPLSERFPNEWAALMSYAQGTYLRDAGADKSFAFDTLLLKVMAGLTERERGRINELAGYEDEQPTKAVRVLSNIRFHPTSNYYCHSKSRYQSDQDGLLIDQFMTELETCSGTDYRIDGQDIVGKLFLYLWDNVFARDKSPLYTLLKCGQQGLRTFGQFVEQRDAFIESVLMFAAATTQGADTAAPDAPVARPVTEPAEA